MSSPLTRVAKSLLESTVYRALDVYVNRRLQDIALYERLEALRDSAEYARQHFAKARACRSRWEVMDLALSRASDEGHYLEFGVFRGESVNYIARRKKQLVHGFDSFDGLPEAWRPGYEQGFFKIANPNALKFERNVVIHTGWFKNSLKEFRENYSGHIAFMHIDCDLYSSTRDILEGISDMIGSGTVVLFDEYFNHPGWRSGEYRAFQEFTSRHDRNYEYIGYNAASEQVCVEIL